MIDDSEPESIRALLIIKGIVTSELYDLRCIFLKENDLYKVVEHIDHNPTYKIVINLETPKLINDLVYTVELADRSQEEINQIKWLKIRSSRNYELQSSDVYVFPDRWEKYDQATKNLWSNYRQSLRDLPTNFIKADDVIWPVKPV